VSAGKLTNPPSYYSTFSKHITLLTLILLLLWFSSTRHLLNPQIPNSLPTHRLAIATIITSDDYVDGVRVLGHSIRTHSPNDSIDLLAAYIPGKLSNYTLCLLTASGWHLRPVPAIDAPKVNGQTVAPAFKRYEGLFTKLWVFAWDEYHHILYLDSDTVMQTRLDELWGLDVGFAAGGDVWSDRLDVGFNSGVMYFRPRRKMFDDMIVSMERDADKYDLKSPDQVGWWDAGRKCLPIGFDCDVL